MTVDIQIGVRNLRYGPLVETVDPVTGAKTYAVTEIKRLEGLHNVKYSKDSKLTPLYYDDAKQKSIPSGLIDPTLEVGLAGLSPEFYHEVLGHEFVNGVLSTSGDEIPEDLAIMYDVALFGGGFRHVAYLFVNGNAPTEDNVEGKAGEEFKEQPVSMKFSCMKRADIDKYTLEGFSKAEGFSLRDFELSVFGKSDIPAE